MSNIKSPLEEMVKNHDAEEVVAWLDKATTELLRKVDDQIEDADPAFLLGTVLTNVTSLSIVVKELNKKMTKQEDGPVVA